MKTAADVLNSIEEILFFFLGFVAVVRWRRRGGAMRAWIAATFGVLALVVALGQAVPKDSNALWVSWFQRAEIAVLALFPYFLYRFASSFLRTRRWMDLTAAALTAASAISILPFRLSGSQTPKGAAFQAWIVLFLISWVLQSMFVAVRLWRGGSGQPKIARLRMRTMSLGVAGLAVALILAGTTRNGGTGALQIAVQALALAAAPLFLIGVGPPHVLLAVWRQDEDEEFRRAIAGLMQASAPADVAAALLPHATRMLGGRASLLADPEGRLIGFYGFTNEEATDVASGRVTSVVRPQGDGAIVAIPLQEGRFLIEASPYTPYFGREEILFLGTLTGLIDLALARSRLSAGERAALAELKAANETMRDFVAIASHDLRTPISVIRGFADVLASDLGSVSQEDARGYLDAIRRQSGYLARLVEDLLTVSRIDARAIQPNAGPLDIDVAVRRAVDDAPYDHGAVRVESTPGLTALVDAEHVARILQNYLDNAFAYGKPPVRVVAARSDGAVQVRVIDAGPGVPFDFVPRMFEKFARADKATSKRAQGTGLGLSIVRGLARAGGGDAWYEPVPDGGACFVVSFPAA